MKRSYDLHEYAEQVIKIDNRLYELKALTEHSTEDQNKKKSY